MTTKIKSGVIAAGAVDASALSDNSITIAHLNCSDGTNGQVLSTDGSGTLSFTDMTGGVDGIVSSADATAITINSSENVGIGTSNPASKLHVSNGSAGIQLSPDGISDGISFLQAYDWVAQTYDGLRYYANEHYFYTGNTERMRIDSSGNVGIGITNPSTRTHIYSSVSSTPLVVESTANTYVGIKNTTQTAYIGAVTSNMYFENNGAEVMRIDSNGNLLIGTTSYSTGAFGSAFGINISATRPQVVLKNETYSTDAYFGLADNLWLGTQDSMNLQFATNDAERMRINSYGGAQFYSDLRSNAKKAEIHNGEGLYVYNNGGGNPVDYGTGAEIRLDGLSHGINATHYLALSGYLPGYNPGQYNCLKTNLGDMHFAAGGVYTGYIGASTGFTDVSDEREKENIVTISNATAKLKQLRGVYHTWKDTENRGTDTHIGLIAQEVEAVVPEVVSTSNPTSLNTPESDTAGLKGVAYAKLVPLLIETIKELEARITTLEE
jgi:hypothetical protein